MYHRQKVEKKSQPRGNWKDDDVNPNPDDYRLKQTTPGFNRNTFTAISSDSVPTTTYSQDNPSNLYRPPHSHQETAPYKKSTYNIEQKIIEDLIQPTGISLKPSENQLKEFFKRAKNLDKEIIFNIINDKLAQYDQIENDSAKVKTLTKCLYLIEYLVQNKLEEIYEAFEERQELFESIRDYFSGNKKIVDVISSIIHIYNPEIPVSKANTVNHVESITKTNLFIDLDEPCNVNTSSTNNIKPSINLLDDSIFGSTTQTNNINPINLIDNSHGNKTNNSSGFKFIKQKQTYDETKQNNELTANLSGNTDANIKKGFSFIKTKPEVTTTNPDIESIFKPASIPIAQSASLIDTFPTVDLTSSKVNDIDEIFNKKTNIDISKVQSSYNENFQTSFDPNKKPALNLDTLMNTQFNYNHVYGNVDTLKQTNVRQDPFNFVNDLLKNPKK